MGRESHVPVVGSYRTPGECWGMRGMAEHPQPRYTWPKGPPHLARSNLSLFDYRLSKHEPYYSHWDKTQNKADMFLTLTVPTVKEGKTYNYASN